MSSVSFSGVFALRDGVSEEEFLPRLNAFLQHFIDVGFASSYRVMRREALEGFGKTYRPSPIAVSSSIQTWNGNVQHTNTSNEVRSRYTRCMLR